MKTWPPMFVVRISDALTPSYFFRSAKERIVMALALLATFQLYGQGTVNFSNIGRSAPVFNSQTCANAVAGTTFSVALYFAPYDPANPVPPDPTTLTQVGVSAFLVAPGIYNDGTRTADGITPPGSFGWFQVKAWETAFGTTYEQAQTNPAALVGVSNIIKVQTGDPGPPPTLPGNLIGISRITLSSASPSLCVVPEPSAIALGLFGAALLSLLRAKKRRR